MQCSAQFSWLPLRSTGRCRFVEGLVWLALAGHSLVFGDDRVEPLPHWLRLPTTSSDSTVEFRKQLTIQAHPPAAPLRLAAEGTDVTVLLNGQTVCVLEEYGPRAILDLAVKLRPGANELLLRCRPSAAEARVLCHLTATRPDRSRQAWMSDSSWQQRRNDDGGSPGEWSAATSFGAAAAHLWDVGPRSIEITPFDDYEQWQQALGDKANAPESFLLSPDFTIETLRTAGPDEGSWVSLEFDPQGRLLIAREDRGLWRMELTDDGSAIAHVAPVPIAAELQECRGLAFLGHDLFVNANNSKALYRLSDDNGDGEFEAATQIREFPGTVGHGRNDLAVHDGRLYSIHGDAVDLPTSEIVDLTSPAREARRGQRTSEGYLLEFDSVANRWTLIAGGLRNPFGIAVHPADGTFFTYDADAEHDLGAPWYRPTRIVEIQPGADYGWRGVTGDWPPYYPDHADNGLPVMDIGKGSPTAVKFGTGSRFPGRYRDALYVLDWAYGRILAVHLQSRGAGYTGQAEVFLRGRPLNVTDLGFGPDGAMYVVTGGRKTQSALYRVRYVGTELAAEAEMVPRAPLPPASWDHLGSLDPHLRQRARIDLERQPLAADGHPAWQSHALEEPRPLAAFTALLALSHVGPASVREDILRRVTALWTPDLTASEKLTALRVGAECLTDLNATTLQSRQALRDRLNPCFPDPAPPTFVPVGLGGPVNHRLAELLVRLESPVAIERTLTLLSAADSQEERLHYLHVLRGARMSWTLQQREEYFAALNAVERDYFGGRGLPDFLKHIREDAVAMLNEAEKGSLAAVIAPPAAPVEEPLPQRPLVREWTLSDLDALAVDDPAGDVTRGRQLFREAACSRCHRFGREGTSVGPELTGLGSRFSRRDILRSILDPAAVVAEIYRNVEVVTTDGRQFVGRLIPSRDYRDTVLQIQTDPLRPAQVQEVPKSMVELHRESPTSPMPAGLLNSLTAEEINDLLAFLRSGGVNLGAASPTTTSAATKSGAD